jgi:outer membrane receptor protein involved in Fe transport
MSNQISQIEFDSILTRCVESLDASSEWCGYVNRALDGSFSSSGGYISSPFYNISSFKTEGIDFNLNYSMNTMLGEIGLSNFTNILLKKNYQESASELKRNCKGTYLLGNSDGLCYQPSPKFQNILSISLKKPTFGFDSEYNLTHRFIDSLKGFSYQNTSNNLPFKKMEYFDFSFSVFLENNLDIYFGVNNLLDNDPPINGDIGYVPGNANTFPSFYDPLGRYLFLKISKKVN